MQKKLLVAVKSLDDGTIEPEGAGGREFESHPGRFFSFISKWIFFLRSSKLKAVTFNFQKKNAIFRYR